MPEGTEPTQEETIIHAEHHLASGGVTITIGEGMTASDAIARANPGRGYAWCNQRAADWLRLAATRLSSGTTEVSDVLEGAPIRLVVLTEAIRAALQ